VIESYLSETTYSKLILLSTVGCRQIWLKANRAHFCVNEELIKVNNHWPVKDVSVD